MDTEQKFSLLYKEADGSVTAFYPRTLPSQVVVSHGENVADHINRSELPQKLTLSIRKISHLVFCV